MNGLLDVQGLTLFFLRLQDQLCVEFFTQARSYALGRPIQLQM